MNIVGTMIRVLFVGTALASSLVSPRAAPAASIFHTDPPPTVSIPGPDLIVLYKELGGFPNYGVSDARADILYSTENDIWTFDLTSLPVSGSIISAKVRLSLTLDDHYGRPDSEYVGRILVNGSEVFAGAFDDLGIKHGAPFAGEFANWRQIEFSVSSLGPSSYTVQIMNDTLGPVGGDWLAIDYIELELRTGPGPGSQPFSVIGVDDLSVGEWAVINGSVASLKSVSVGKAATIARGACDIDDVASGDMVSLKEFALIDGHVRTNAVHLGHDALITGAVRPPPFSIAPLPMSPVGPGTDRVFVAKGGEAVLESGTYQSVETAEKTVIHLTGGTYKIAALRLGKATSVVFNEPTTVNVGDHLDLDENVVLLTDGLSAAQIQLNYQGVMDALLGKHVQGVLTLVAPNALIQLGEGGVYTGRIWGQRVRVGKGVRITGGACLVDDEGRDDQADAAR